MITGITHWLTGTCAELALGRAWGQGRQRGDKAQQMARIAHEPRRQGLSGIGPQNCMPACAQGTRT